MVYRAVGVLLWLALFTGTVFAQQKLATGIYKTIANSSFTYIDEFGDTLYLDPVAICTAADFVSVVMDFGYAGKPVIKVELNDAGRTHFAIATRESVGKKLAIIGNGRLLSAPVVQSEIAGGMFEISGAFTVEEAKALAGRIRKDIPEQKRASAGPTLETQELKTLITALENALIAKDTSRLKILLHDDLSLGHSNGWIESKAELLQHLSSGYLVYQDISPIGDIEVSVKESVARVRRKIKVKGIADKNKFELELGVLEVWLQEDGAWKLWSRQSIGKK